MALKLSFALAASLFVGAAHAAGANDDPGKQLFTGGAKPPCALCHTLQDAGAQGAIGPSLDEIKPDAERVKKAVKLGVGAMPAFTTLTEEQIDAIARYVERATQ